MYSCLLHNWISFEIPCPSCQTTVTTGGDVPIQIMAQQSPSKDTGVLVEALEKIAKEMKVSEWDGTSMFPELVRECKERVQIARDALAQYSSPSQPEEIPDEELQDLLWDNSVTAGSMEKVIEVLKSKYHITRKQ